MAKRPWMPLYIADYLGGTYHLKTIEHGAYLLLIMFYWDKGGLPDDEEVIRRIARMDRRQWRHSRDTLRSLFGDNWCHHRVDKEIAQAIEKSMVNSANAKRSLSVRYPVAENPLPTLQTQTIESKKEATSLRSVSRRRRDSTEFPAEFICSRDHARLLGWAESRIDSEADRFKSNALAKGLKYKNWDYAWRNWVTSPYQKSGEIVNGIQTNRPNGRSVSPIKAALDRQIEFYSRAADDERKQREAVAGLLPGRGGK